jgi:hypothetical protein
MLGQLAMDVPTKSSQWTSEEKNTVYHHVFMEEPFLRESPPRLKFGLSKWTDPSQFNLEARLAEIAAGRAPENNIERVSLAQTAYAKGVAARFRAETLASDPAVRADFVDGSPWSNRYWAARAAALAGCEKGENPELREVLWAEREVALAEFRNLARTWLEAELASWSADLQSTDAEVRGRAVDALRWWQFDPHFEGVRDVEAFKTRSEREPEDWLTFWSKVEALLAETK